MAAATILSTPAQQRNMTLTTLRDLAFLDKKERKKPLISYISNISTLPPHIAEKYVQLGMDVETAGWIKQAGDMSVIKMLVSDLLRSFFCRTTANGIVGRGGMFVMSTAQAMCLLLGSTGGEQSFPTGSLFDRLLDIGAGDGGVTSRLQPLFRRVTATECSIPMRWRLWWRGYEVLPYQDPFQAADGSRRFYDVISCLNVLDRADKPLGLLHSIRNSLTPDGVLLLAVVLPWCPFVEHGRSQRRPSEVLPMEGGECCRGATFEESLQRLVDNVLIPCGFKLERWSKLPYLSEGNYRVEYAVLHDAVFVLKRNDGGVPSL